jgi:hypothetical protein
MKQTRNQNVYLHWTIVQGTWSSVRFSGRPISIKLLLSRTDSKDGYNYELEVGHNLCDEDCNDYLTVMQGGKAVSHQVCTESKN